MICFIEKSVLIKFNMLGRKVNTNMKGLHTVEHSDPVLLDLLSLLFSFVLL